VYEIFVAGSKVSWVNDAERSLFIVVARNPVELYHLIVAMVYQIGLANESPGISNNALNVRHESQVRHGECLTAHRTNARRRRPIPV
jgi:hypothetical protein